MSNHNKPKFSLPGAPPPPLAPPPAPTDSVPAEFAALIERFPLPWCVGPDGYLWVAADVEKVTDKTELNRLGVTSDGWRATGNVARLVLEHKLPADFAAAILSVVNNIVR